VKNIILFFAAVLFISVTACAQTPNDLPAKVKNAFDQKFPGAQKVKWSNEKANEWEAEFKLSGKEYSANYNADGSWMETELEISKKEIPFTVTNALTKEFPGYKVEESVISETATGKVYEFKLKVAEELKEITVNTYGTIIKKENLKEKADNY
jgi:hypothetical protein